MDAAELVRRVEGDAGLRALLGEARARLDEDPGHDVAHALRVARWTVALAEAEAAAEAGSASRAVAVFREAVAAALLHDVVNVPKNSPDRAKASELSAAVAAELLPVHGFDAAAVARVCEAIRDHSFSRGAVPSGPLGRALQDADRLEALGALGLMRTVSTGARMGAKYFHAEDPWAERRELNDLAFSVDHFFRKLLTLETTLTTAAGRREARRRTAFLRAFLAQLAEEIGTPLPAVRGGASAASLDDAALFAAFRAATLPAAEWTHAAHVRVAWMFLAEAGSVDAAHVLMRVGIIRLNAAHGLEETVTRGYHETLTRVWLALVAEARAAHPAAASSAAFLAAAAPALTQDAPLRHYTKASLASLEARARFIPPDLAPLPA